MIWTDKKDEQLRRLYPDTQTAVIALLFGCPVRTVHNRAGKLGVHKSADFLRVHGGRLDGVVGAKSRFAKGHTPWNAGKKGLRAGGRSAETRFPKGHVPHTRVPVGTVVKDNDGYLKIKVAEPNVWRYVHRMTWEEANGHVPPGMALAFKDRNRENCAPENLELITRAELCRRNTIHRYPPELKAAIRTLGKLKRTIEAKHEKQD